MKGRARSSKENRFGWIKPGTPFSVVMRGPTKTPNLKQPMPMAGKHPMAFKPTKAMKTMMRGR